MGLLRVCDGRNQILWLQWKYGRRKIVFVGRLLVVWPTEKKSCRLFLRVGLAFFVFAGAVGRANEGIGVFFIAEVAESSVKPAIN